MSSTSSRDYDLFVIGAGSGGVRAARIAASHGARVGIAEEHRFGGTCVIRGCIPKKLLVLAAQLGDDIHHAKHFGWSVGSTTHDWKALIAGKDREIARLSAIYSENLDRYGVDLYHQRATVAGPHSVQVGDETLSSEHILIATGGTPFIPGIPGCELGMTSNEALALPERPERIVVVGGGYIGVEFASIFHGLGTQVTLVHRGPHILRGFDHDIGHFLQDALIGRGVEVRLDTDVHALRRDDGGIRVQLDDHEEIATDAVLFATGRIPNTASLGLDDVGVKLGPRGEVVVDETSKSSVDSIYAVGDCTDRVALTPVAIREGHAVADTLFGSKPTTVDYSCIPTAVFSLPTVGTVGLTEHDAHQRYGKIDVYESRFRPLKRTLTDDTEKVFIKMLVAPDADDRVVGVHMVGADAPEIIQLAAVALRMGASKADFDATMAVHPTTAEELVLLKTKLEPKLPSS